MTRFEQTMEQEIARAEADAEQHDPEAFGGRQAVAAAAMRHALNLCRTVEHCQQETQQPRTIAIAQPSTSRPREGHHGRH